MKNNISDLVHDVVASPLGDVIASVAEGVAEAQQALDEGSLAKTLEIYAEDGEEGLKVLREIDYRPTFYAIPEVTGEVRVSLHLGSSLSKTEIVKSTNASLQPLVRSIGGNRSIKPRIYATPVDAGYANRYGYKADISAKLTFKIVPVPAPDGADELRVLPNFVGKTIAESRIIAENLGIETSVENTKDISIETLGSQEVVAQTPEINPKTIQYIRLGEDVILIVG